MAVPEPIAEFLRSRGKAFDAVEHAETFTSVAEAQSLGVDAGEVAKTIVLRSNDRLALLALPASSRVDMAAVHHALNDPHARFATEEEMARDLADYALGSVPPFADLVGAPVYLDDHLLGHETVIFAAGTHTDSIRMRVADLKAVGPWTAAEVCRERHGKD